MQKKFRRLDQANGVSAQGIKVSLPKASLQSGLLPEASHTLAQVTPLGPAVPRLACRRPALLQNIHGQPSMTGRWRSIKVRILGAGCISCYISCSLAGKWGLANHGQQASAFGAAEATR